LRRDVTMALSIASMEIGAVSDRTSARRMTKSAFGQVGQTLESFDFAFQPAIERSRIETLATGAWVRGKETVLLQGAPGVGKTHLAVGLGVKAVQLGLSAQYHRFDEPMTALKGDSDMPPARLIPWFTDVNPPLTAPHPHPTP